MVVIILLDALLCFHRKQMGLHPRIFIGFSVYNYSTRSWCKIVAPNPSDLAKLLIETHLSVSSLHTYEKAVQFYQDPRMRPTGVK